jgi:hypothetical protein
MLLSNREGQPRKLTPADCNAAGKDYSRIGGSFTNSPSGLMRFANAKSFCANELKLNNEFADVKFVFWVSGFQDLTP